jgi:hypothetical protein
MASLRDNGEPGEIVAPGRLSPDAEVEEATETSWKAAARSASVLEEGASEGFEEPLAHMRRRSTPPETPDEPVWSDTWNAVWVPATQRRLLPNVRSP